jgi:hypothetical protein
MRKNRTDEDKFQYEFSKKLISKEGKILDSNYKGKSTHPYVMEQMSALHPTVNPVLFEWVIKTYMSVVTTIMRSLEIGKIRLPYLGSFNYNAYHLFRLENPTIQSDYRKKKLTSEEYMVKFNEFINRERHDGLHFGHTRSTKNNLD